MKKTIYLIIISIVTILCIVGGCIYHGANFNFGGFPWGLNWFEDDDNDIKMIKDAAELDRFTNIKSELDVMDISVLRGDAYKIEIAVSDEKYMPEYSVNNDILTIKQKISNKNKLKKAKCRMKVFVPNNESLKDISIEDAVGDIKIDDMDCDNIILSSSTGDVKLFGVKAIKSVVNSSVGDIKIDGSEFTETSISGNIGDVEILAAQLGDTSISNNTGDVKLDQCLFADPGRDMIISTNTGDVKVTGCPDPGLFECDFSTDLGEVVVNGNNYKKNYTMDDILSSNTEVTSRFKITTNIGDVKVEMK